MSKIGKTHINIVFPTAWDPANVLPTTKMPNIAMNVNIFHVINVNLRYCTDQNPSQFQMYTAVDAHSDVRCRAQRTTEINACESHVTCECDVA